MNQSESGILSTEKVPFTADNELHFYFFYKEGQV